jgi:predicted signal transduction protein with EAL and GGDEF domain
MGTQLREAIAGRQFCLVYQPQVDIDTGRIVGVEALVRRHPTRGLVMPGQFIPAAEKNGLIVPLGRWVLGEACRQTRRWLDAGIAPALMAVNLSAVQFKMPLDLENDIIEILAESALPASRLELELTESALMETSREHNDTLLRLHARGVRMARPHGDRRLRRRLLLSRLSAAVPGRPHQDRPEVLDSFQPRNRCAAALSEFIGAAISRQITDGEERRRAP